MRINWRDLAIEALLELDWWRQEYGDRGISYGTRLALLQPPPIDRSYVRRAALPSQSQEPEAVSRFTGPRAPASYVTKKAEDKATGML
jgi:hypothetical protein